MKSSSSIPHADEAAKQFTQDTFIFDCLALFYILDEPWAQRCVEAGVNAANVTFSAEGAWDDTVRAIDTGLEKIAKSSYLTTATTRAVGCGMAWVPWLTRLRPARLLWYSASSAS